MNNFGEKKRRLIELLKSPLGVGIIVVLVILIALIVASVTRLPSNKDHNSYRDEITTEYDPASQTEITNLPMTNGPNHPGEIRFVAAEELIDMGVPLWHWAVFQHAIEQFAKENDIDLFRVSYLKDSYKLAKTYVFDFKVVLNIDKQTISVRIDGSKNKNDILESVYILSDESGKELYRFEVTEANICKFDGTCPEAE